MSNILSTKEELWAHYGKPKERTVLKTQKKLDKHCRDFLALSPFMLIATASPAHGADCSPKGDKAGFVKVLDDKHLVIPDRPGNNRIDSLLNIIDDPQIGLLFLIPGVNETLRINGEAEISVEPELLAMTVVDGKEPRSVILVTVKEAFIHCAKSFMRAELWNPEKQIERSSFASMGQILKDHIKLNEFDVESYDSEMLERYRQSLY